MSVLALRLLLLAPGPVRKKVVDLLPHRHQVALIRRAARVRNSPLLPAVHPLGRDIPTGPGIPTGRATSAGYTAANTAAANTAAANTAAANTATGDIGPARVRVRAGRHTGTVIASVWDIASPADLRRHNLARVTAVLHAAAVPYFRVPHARQQRTRIAVPAHWRTRALSALTGSPDMAGAVLRGAPAPWRADGSRADGARGGATLRDAPVAEAFWAVTDPGRCLVLADEFACEIEFWTASGDLLVAPDQAPITPPVHRDSPVVFAPDRDFDEFCPYADDGARFPTRRELMLAGLDWVRFPIDAVYTWVDGSDPRWQRRKAAALAANGWAAGQPQSANASRYLCRDELRFSLRSLHYHAPWLRRIFLVTDAQVPRWLDRDHPGVTVVDHREIFGDVGRLPTFNSQAIEARLHHVPGLAEHFLYLNDDVFLGRPQRPGQFFLPSGIARFFPSCVPVHTGPVTGDDPPIMASGKNNRAVLAERFGRLLTQKMRHTPHPQRRSVLAEIEQQCQDRVRATAGHQFRHPDDISVPSSLQHYWAYLTGRAVPADLSYQYTDLNHPATPLRLMALARHRHRDVFCLNDTESNEAQQRRHAALLDAFLPAYFPFPAPFELAGPRPTGPDRAVPPVAVPVPDPLEIALEAATPQQTRGREPSDLSRTSRSTT